MAVGGGHGDVSTSGAGMPLIFICCGVYTPRGAPHDLMSLGVFFVPVNYPKLGFTMVVSL